MDVDQYRSARAACEIAKTLLEQHDFDELVRACENADNVGPFVDPTAWKERGQAMREDLEVFRAARKFLQTWPRWKVGQAVYARRHDLFGNVAQVDAERKMASVKFAWPYDPKAEPRWVPFSELMTTEEAQKLGSPR